MTTFLALFKLLPQIVQLLSFIQAMVHDREQQGLGRQAALADALTQAHQDLAYADAIAAEAEIAHQKDKTDASIDPDFWRPD